jgi:sugar phosphate isomerase/epimerase
MRIQYAISLWNFSHYALGTGGIPLQDWELLTATLQEIGFDGTAVFEIRPRNPYQTARLGQHFLENLHPHK